MAKTWMAGTSPAMTDRDQPQTKRPAARPVFSLPAGLASFGRAPCGCRGAFDRFLRGVLGVAHGLLALALPFLTPAFALHAVGTGGFTDALLALADRLVGGALDLVARAT